MKSKPQLAIELIKLLTPAEKKVIYKKLHEELNCKLTDFLDAGSTAPCWLDS